MSHDSPRDPPNWIDVHFALFVLVDVSTDVSYTPLSPKYILTNLNQQINQVLQKSYDGANLNSWHLWLADSYTNTPRKQGDQYMDGTKPPVPKEWKSPFLGKTIPEAAEFIKKLPNEATVDWHHFVVIDEDFLKSGIVNLWRIGDEDLKGDELDVLPCSVEHSTLELYGIGSRGWEETKSNVEAGYSPI